MNIPSKSELGEERDLKLTGASSATVTVELRPCGDWKSDIQHALF